MFAQIPFFFSTGVNKHVSSCRLSSFLVTCLLQTEVLRVGHCDSEDARPREDYNLLSDAKTGQIEQHDTKRDFPDASNETGMARNERPPEEKKGNAE